MDELRSFKLHCNKYFKPSAEAKVPSEDMQQRILYEMEQAYSGAVWNLDDDFLSHESFLKAVKRLDMTSSPGYPYMSEAPTNGQWLKFNGLYCDEYQLVKLWNHVQAVFADEWDTVLRCFIKQEPHKKSKAREGRWRLIVASPLCVQVAWHMLFDPLNDLEIERSFQLPSQQGIKMFGGGWRQYLELWQSRGYTHGLDKSAWDFTAPFWAIMMDLELRRRLGRGRQLGEWYKLARILFRHMFEDPTILFSDGSLYKQYIPGIVKSGCVCTISINSHCQGELHVAVCLDLHLPIHPFPVCCGDDTLHALIHVCDISAYEKYGVVVKTASEGMEFVGHEFTNSGPHPLYFAKHLKRLMYQTTGNLPDYFECMARMYVHTRYYDLWDRMATLNGTPVPLSKDAVRYWYDFEC